MECFFSASSAFKQTDSHDHNTAHYCSTCRHLGGKDEMMEEKQIAQSAHFPESGLSSPEKTGAATCHSSHTHWRDKLIWALRHGGEDFFSVGHYLVMGLLSLQWRKPT
jgi:uncharacterized membrane protein YraQ (UPF0718 family)